MSKHTIYIKVLSPIHIGTGDTYEPTDFFVDHKERYLGVINFEKIAFYLSKAEIEKFIALCRQGSIEAIVKLYSFVDNVCLKLISEGKNEFLVRKINLSNSFIEHYQRLKSLSGSQLRSFFNRFNIEKTAFSPNENLPFLPGSSIKGAIRTAVLNLWKDRARGKSWKDYCRGSRCDSKQLESEILDYPKKKFNEDPFRFVKVSDFKPISFKTKVVYAVNVRRDGSRGRGPYQIIEVIEPGSMFKGEITVLSNNKGITFELLLESLKSFYEKESQREEKKVKHLNVNPPVFSSNAYPIRIGKHSGAECVTIEGFRRIYIKKGFSDSPTTAWFASDSFKLDGSVLLPFGWAELYLDSPPEDPVKNEVSSVDLSKLETKFRVVRK